MQWGSLVILAVVVLLAIRTRRVDLAALAIVGCLGVGSVRELFAMKVASRNNIAMRYASGQYSGAYRDGVLDMQRSAYESSCYAYYALGGLAVLAVGFFGAQRRT